MKCWRMPGRAAISPAMVSFGRVPGGAAIPSGQDHGRRALCPPAQPFLRDPVGIVKKIADAAGATLPRPLRENEITAFTLQKDGRITIEFGNGGTFSIATEADRRAARLPANTSLSAENFLGLVHGHNPLKLRIVPGKRFILGANSIREAGRE